MDFLKSFAETYGFSFLVMVVIAFVIAIVTEISVKKAFVWLEEKLGQKKGLMIAKIVCIQSVTILLTVWFTTLLVKGMPFPGSFVLYPVWVGLMYILQYFFSLWGVKGFLNWISKRAERKAEKEAAKERAEANKPVLTPVPGTTGLFKDAEGNFCDAKGRRL